MTNFFDIFSPSAALDPRAFAGVAGAQRLLAAAAHFPGGPVMLVFALFWAPVGPGIPAGVLLARHIPLNPSLTLALYALSDVLSALLFAPVYALLRQYGRRIRPVRWLGRRLLNLAMVGVRRMPPEEVRGGHIGLGPTLFRIATVGFGVDIYTAGMLASGLPVPRIAGWASAVAGDLLWFGLLLGTSIATARVVDDDWVIGIVVVIAMVLIPVLARKIFPSLR
jgi:hypothetical protein